MEGWERCFRPFGFSGRRAGRYAESVLHDFRTCVARPARRPLRFGSAWCAALLCLCVAGGVAGCRNAEPAAGAAAKATQHYKLAGTVVAVDASAGELTVRHGAIPGFMPAMTMPYKVQDAKTLAGLRAGDTIAAEIAARPGTDDYRLESITVTARGAGVAATTVRPLAVGDAAPELPLVNQDGKTTRLTEARGKALLVTFIYTRCPLPTACPLITSHFARVNRALEADATTRAATRLVSITLDPAYDTPPVLRNYGLAYLNGDAAGFEHWEFATATPGDLKKLADAFGLQYEWQNNQIVHTMQTILIGKDGRVARTWAGSAWDPDEVAAATRAAALKTAHREMR